MTISGSSESNYLLKSILNTDQISFPGLVGNQSTTEQVHIKDSNLDLKDTYIIRGRDTYFLEILQPGDRIHADDIVLEMGSANINMHPPINGCNRKIYYALLLVRHICKEEHMLFRALNVPFASNDIYECVETNSIDYPLVLKVFDGEVLTNSHVSNILFRDLSMTRIQVLERGHNTYLFVPKAIPQSDIKMIPEVTKLEFKSEFVILHSSRNYAFFSLFQDFFGFELDPIEYNLLLLFKEVDKHKTDVYVENNKMFIPIATKYVFCNHNYLLINYFGNCNKPIYYSSSDDPDLSAVASVLRRASVLSDLILVKDFNQIEINSESLIFVTKRDLSGCTIYITYRTNVTHIEPVPADEFDGVFNAMFLIDEKAYIYKSPYFTQQLTDVLYSYAIQRANNVVYIDLKDFMTKIGISRIKHMNIPIISMNFTPLLFFMTDNSIYRSNSWVINSSEDRGVIIDFGSTLFAFRFGSFKRKKLMHVVNQYEYLNTYCKRGPLCFIRSFYIDRPEGSFISKLLMLKTHTSSICCWIPQTNFYETSISDNSL